jgi:formyltetrahydrofolate-dependent phosphoribosylglycinamide formyltransferase
MSHLRLGFLVSGNGTIFESITTHCQAGILDAEAAVLISSDPQAPALQRAARLNVPSRVLARTAFADGTEFAVAMLRAFDEHQVNFVCLAGYMKLVPPSVVRTFHHRMLNIHPALLPAFGGKGMYGRRVHEAVVEYGARISGATVHLVDEEYDHGPIVLQRGVFVKPDDTAEDLEARVHEIEHELYVHALQLFAQDRIEIVGRKVRILPGKST